MSALVSVLVIFSIHTCHKSETQGREYDEETKKESKLIPVYFMSAFLLFIKLVLFEDFYFWLLETERF
jgi:hypothetical protein